MLKRLTAAEPAASWYLWGEYGVGKTGLGVGLARRWLELADIARAEPQVVYAVLPDVLGELRASYQADGRQASADSQGEGQIIDRLGYCRFLLLDDLGAEGNQGTPWLQDSVYRIVNARHGHCLPTVYTSNLPLEPVKGKAGLNQRWGQRTADRIKEMCGPGHVAEVVGPNLRTWKE